MRGHTRTKAEYYSRLSRFRIEYPEMEHQVLKCFVGVCDVDDGGHVEVFANLSVKETREGVTVSNVVGVEWRRDDEGRWWIVGVRSLRSDPVVLGMVV